MADIETTVTQEKEPQADIATEDESENVKQNEVDENQMDVQTLHIKKDIYNTFVILKATIIHEKHGGSQSLWDSKFSTEDRVIFCFFLWMITIIQIGGFFILYNDATDFAVQNLVTQGNQVYLDSGMVDFQLVNVTTNYTMQISYADLTLLDSDPKMTNDVDLSLLFSQLVADVCMVLYLFKGLTQSGKLYHLAKYLPEYHEKKRLIIILMITKLTVWFLGSMSSLCIIALATTSIEAFEKAIAVFFLAETSEWVYGLISAHPEIDDGLYKIHVYLTDKIFEENNEEAIDERKKYEENELKQAEYEIYERLREQHAFTNIFIQTLTFLFLYIGCQFVFLLDYFAFWVLIISAFVLVCYDNRRNKQFKKEAARLAKEQVALKTIIIGNDYH